MAILWQQTQIEIRPQIVSLTKERAHFNSNLRAGSAARGLFFYLEGLIVFANNNIIGFEICVNDAIAMHVFARDE